MTKQERLKFIKNRFKQLDDEIFGGDGKSDVVIPLSPHDIQEEISLMETFAEYKLDKFRDKAI